MSVAIITPESLAVLKAKCFFGCWIVFMQNQKSFFTAVADIALAYATLSSGKIGRLRPKRGQTYLIVVTFEFNLFKIALNIF